MSKADNILLKKGQGPWTVEFFESATLAREPNFFRTWTTAVSTITAANKTWAFQPKLEFQPELGLIEFREAYVEVVGGRIQDVLQKAVAGRVILPASHFELLQFKPNTSSDDTVEIILRLKEGQSLGSFNFNDGSLAYRTYQGSLLRLLAVKQAAQINKIRVVRLRFGNISKNVRFNTQKIHALLRGVVGTTVSDLAEAFVVEQEKALKAEDDVREGAATSQMRKNATVRVTARSHTPPGLVYTISSNVPHDEWLIETQTKIRLLAPRIFTEEAPARDAGGCKGWTARVTGHETSTITANCLTPFPADEYALYDGEVVTGVTISLVDEDLMKDRLHRAVRTARIAFGHELDNLAIFDSKLRRTAQLQIPLSRLFVHHPDINPLGWSGNPITHTSGTSVSYREEWRLEESHKRVFNTIVAGRGGITGIQGPPGTGKTTLIAKCVAIALTLYHLEGKVVLIAHSNQAAQVLLEKCHENFGAFGIDPEEEVVLVETAGGVQRRRQTARTLPVGLEAYSLESQLLIHARSEPERFAAYLRLHGTFTRGEPLTVAETKHYFTSRALVIDALREKKRVFICTIATANTKFFQHRKDNKSPGFKCSMLFLDEASQCPIPYLLEAWETLNPQHLIIGGDDMQLESYAESQIARAIWRYSAISHARRIGQEISVLLDVQFRMPPNLYQPTSVTHYGGLIRTPDSSRGRPYEVALSQKISLIEVDPKGDGKQWIQLDSSAIIFDLSTDLDSKSHGYGAHSAANPTEVSVVERFISILNRAGVSYADIMALTPYEGQFQLLKRAKASMNAFDLAVRKIDSSQGAESPIVVFSPVKTGLLGFMHSTQRQNVATSRQKSAFFLVGSLSVLRQSKVWSQWYVAVQNANRNIGRTHFDITHRCRFRLRPGAEGYTPAPHIPTTTTAVVQTEVKPTFVAKPQPKPQPQRTNLPLRTIPTQASHSVSAVAKENAAALWSTFKANETWSGGRPAFIADRYRNTPGPSSVSVKTPTHIQDPSSVTVKSLTHTPATNMVVPALPNPALNPAQPMRVTSMAIPDEEVARPRVVFPPTEEAFVASLPAQVGSLDNADTTPFDDELITLQMQQDSWSEGQQSAAHTFQLAITTPDTDMVEATLSATAHLSHAQINAVKRLVKVLGQHNDFLDERRGY